MSAGLLVGSRLEVVEKIELHVVDECRGQLVQHAIAIVVLTRERRRRLLDPVDAAIEHHAGRSRYHVRRWQPC